MSAILSSRELPDLCAHLTPRRVEVMTLVADGFTNKEIAFRLGIARSTVSEHLLRIFEVIGAVNRAHAAAKFVRHIERTGTMP